MRSPRTTALIAAKDADQWLSTRLGRRRRLPRLPRRLAAIADRAYHPLVLRLITAKYRLKYGRPLLSALDPEDDLLHYGFQVAGYLNESFEYYHGVRSYFEGGDWNAAEVEKVLAESGHPLEDSGSLLEFAAGYGRVTRHLVQRVDPARVTVSDIDARGVDFLERELGVRGFYSTASPAELDHDGRYHTVVVVSLFSHIPLRDWEAWLRRMGDLLQPGGILLFSTQGPRAFEVNQVSMDSVRREAEGFLFQGANETRGRLDAEQYGTAYVEESYVKGAIESCFPGRLLRAVPRALNDYQDAYVLQRDA